MAQIILRWMTQRGVVAIPKSVRKDRMKENFNVFDIELSPEDMATIATLDTKTSSFFLSSQSEHGEMVEWSKTQYRRSIV